MITAWMLVNLKISVEHGWLCIRQQDERLLWTKKLEELPAKGFTLESLTDDFEKAMRLIEAEKKGK
jgi:hypothetical protein